MFRYKKQVLGVFIGSAICISLFQSSVIFATPKTKNVSIQKEAVFLGVDGYGQKTKKDSLDTLRLKFSIDGKTTTLPVNNGRKNNGIYSFPIQNKLQEGYIYHLTIQNNIVQDAVLLDSKKDALVSGTVTAIGKNFIKVNHTEIPFDKNTKCYQITWKAGGSTVQKIQLNQLKNKTVKVTYNAQNKAKNVYVSPIGKPYTPPVKGVAGTKTLKNFLTTALQPVGTVVYVYGGGWDWQDKGSGMQTTHIGIPNSWIDFYQFQNKNYTYREKNGNTKNKNPKTSYYPYGAWNQYYYAGADCSGYLGWVIYNTMNSESGKEGYVMNSTKTAKTLAQKGWGTWTQKISIPKNHKNSDFRPGDIFSMNGHVWICLGTCEDGSIVITHSTPSNSVSGQPGGGIQISAIGAPNCQAHALAKKYMSTFYPDWSSRYNVIVRKPSDYTKVKQGTPTGKFSWNLTNGFLTDPDGYATMTPEEILEDIFKTPQQPEQLEDIFLTLQQAQQPKDIFLTAQQVQQSEDIFQTITE